MAKSSPVPLSAEQLRDHEQRGYCSPIPVLTNTEAAEFTYRFMEYISYNKERLEPLPPRDRYKAMAETHTFLNWAYRIVSRPRVLDAVESLLGPDLLVWSTRWFSKMPGEKAYVSWHQDAGYWGLRPPKVTSAWVALSESVPENGCMRVVPGTHKWPLLPKRTLFLPIMPSPAVRKLPPRSIRAKPLTSSYRPVKCHFTISQLSTGLIRTRPVSPESVWQSVTYRRRWRKKAACVRVPSSFGAGMNMATSISWMRPRTPPL